jgi:hypothetical protein
MSTWIKQNPLIPYFMIAFVFSWAIYLLLVAVKHGWTSAPIPFSLHYLASFGPTLAALIVTSLTTGKAGLKELWSRITKWRVKGIYAAFAIFSPIVLFVISLPIIRLVRGEWPDLHLLGHALFDLLTASKAGQDIIPIVTTAGVIVWALFVANVEKPWGFRFQEKQML